MQGERELAEGLNNSHFIISMLHDTYRAVRGVGAAEVRARPGAKVGIVTFWLVNPLPSQILPEVDVERPNAAVLLIVSVQKKKRPSVYHFNTCMLDGTDVSRTSMLALCALINMSDSLLRR